MNLLRTAGISLLAIGLISCGKKDVPLAPPSLPQTGSTPMPDVGKVDTVMTTATGYGSSPGEATADAMKSAILQVNGATIDTASVKVKYGLDITDGQDAVSLRASEFAEKVAQSSGGAITNFKIDNVTEPKQKGDPYKVTIEANIAHLTAPADSKKIKVVVAPIRFDTNGFMIGSERVPSAKVAGDIQQQVSIALTNTGRFSVLDRGDDADVQQELDMIKSGDAPRAENGKIGQAVTADVIWAGHISNLAYNRHARQLQTSDRELVSYSGGWGMSQKLVNVATRQILTSDSLQGQAPEIAATTMSSGINSAQVLQDMESQIASKVVASILTHTFPVTVIQRDGNTVVLSQGGESVQAGTRYALVAMGTEMKDPQTGESLGRTELPCCDVVIDRVTPKLSYGHLENVTTSLDNIPSGGLQLREQLKSIPVAVETRSDDQARSSPNQPKILTAQRKSDRPNPATASPNADPKEDGKW
jgi:curli biogenesis system outer membrane secretion channel CsgG